MDRQEEESIVGGMSTGRKMLKNRILWTHTEPAINVSDQNYQRQRQLFNLREMAINRRWDTLHDGREYFRLRDSIMREVHSKSLRSRHVNNKKAIIITKQ